MAVYAFAMLIGLVVLVSIFLLFLAVIAMNAAGFPSAFADHLAAAGRRLVIMSVRGDEATVASNARWTALWTSLIVLALSLVLWARFDQSDPGFQFVESAPGCLQWGITYQLGVDGISVLFVLLSTALTPICILASWESITVRVREYMLAFLMLETMMVGMFCALDFVVFYMFFEGVLIPMYLIIGVWGGPRRVYAADEVLPVHADRLGADAAGAAGHVVSGQHHRHHGPAAHDLPAMRCRSGCSSPSLPRSRSRCRCGRCTRGCRTRMWRRRPPGSVILAAVLLKMGAYGFLRFSVPMLPQASAELAPLIFALSVIAVVYTSFVALAQTDMKKLIAYSSVAHMGVVTIGIFTFNVQGISGALFQMLVARRGLRRFVPVRRRRLRPHAYARDRPLRRPGRPDADLRVHVHAVHAGQHGPARYLGLRRRVPGAGRRLQVNFWLALFGSLGMILGAVYMLYLYRR